VLDLAFQPDRGSDEPLYRQLELHLRELIETRRLPASERLPASRELASTLGLSRNTVNQAYQVLTEEGLLRSRVGQGTFVTPVPRLSLEPRAVPAEAGERRPFAWAGLFAKRTRGVKVPAGIRAELAAPEPRFDFRGGQVDATALPEKELARAYSRALERAQELANLRSPLGYAPLREQVARSLLARGIRCAPDEVAIVNGAQQALDLVARTLVDPGETVVMEQPGYFGAAVAFAGAEAHLIGVSVDAEGLCTDELARLLRTRRVKLVFTTPAVQSPTGVAMSGARRRELLALADEYQVPLLEDDYDSELRYGASLPPALKNEDAAGQVIYAGTFTKALFGGIRVGYVVAAAPLLQRLLLTRWVGDVQTDLVSQAALADLLESGVFERHVRRVRKRYTARRAALLGALERTMPDGFEWVEPAGGNAVWATLPPGVDGAALFERAVEAGVGYGRGDAFFLDGSGLEHLSLSFAGLAPDAIDTGVERLAELIGRVRR